MKNKKNKNIVIGTIIAVLIIGLSIISSTKKSSDITFFTQDGCSYCKYAMDYISTKYPELEMKVINIRYGRGMEQLRVEAKKRGLSDVGTPFILLGEKDYIVGWSEESADKFDAYMNSLPPKNNNF